MAKMFEENETTAITAIEVRTAKVENNWPCFETVGFFMITLCKRHNWEFDYQGCRGGNSSRSRSWFAERKNSSI
jgi:hypothetical protein